MHPGIVAIDLFCGVGGLTRGLEKAGLRVKAGIDVDPACEYPYEANNGAHFIKKSVEELSAKELDKLWGRARIRLLAGCAPCQPFSTYRQGIDEKKDSRWRLLHEFRRLIMETEPELITMENVPLLEKHPVFRGFVKKLKKLEYHIHYSIVDCSDYGVPQVRQRLVLLASRLGPISLIEPTHTPENRVTVRQAISKLPPLKAGEIDKKDKTHKASILSALNQKRIRQSKPNGTWRDWKPELVADCHKKKTGKTYPSVYGRMSWDEPAPTMTTQFFGFGNGRFGHPEQDRAISLREGAIFQSFPKGYKFVRPGEPVFIKTVGRLIGNAVPVKLGYAIGRSLLEHVERHS